MSNVHLKSITLYLVAFLAIVPFHFHLLHDKQVHNFCLAVKTGSFYVCMYVGVCARIWDPVIFLVELVDGGECVLMCLSVNVFGIHFDSASLTITTNSQINTVF